MSWDFLGMSEEEAQKARFNLFSDGEYDARIDKVEDGYSKNSGNRMATLHLVVFGKDNENCSAKDFLPNTAKMVWKIRHCALSAGLEKEWDKKTFSPEMLDGRIVRVRLGTQLGGKIPTEYLNGKPEGSCYPDKNIVEDYIVSSVDFSDIPVSKPPKQDDVPFIDDVDLPF